MVAPRELKDAGGDMIEAMARKASALALRLEVPLGMAWKLLADERAALMPHTDQKQPTAEPKKTGERATFVMIPEGPGAGLAGQSAAPVSGEWAEPLSLFDASGAKSPRRSHPVKARPCAARVRLGLRL